MNVMLWRRTKNAASASTPSSSRGASPYGSNDVGRPGGGCNEGAMPLAVPSCVLDKRGRLILYSVLYTACLAQPLAAHTRSMRCYSRVDGRPQASPA